MASIGGTIKNLLSEQGKTQAQLSRALGVNVTTVNRWIRKGIVPNTTNLFEMSKFFNVPVYVLLKGGD